ncbi:Cupredoxins domain-containing protein [Dioscorea alata]|uniref:Cupredoxins domain-containing protein n=1 Tax=Dioscorea alata TaxID=55571 RepID=A0ACB7V5C0_DIOAL|nr:Cupredoxins domain-containing protein [Dioscorea alata]
MAGITPFLALLLVVAAAPALATDYTVGDSQQWNLGVNYSTWVSGKTFKVGDNLVFTYSKSSHDVAEVNKADYGSCSKNNIIKTYNDGNTTIALNTTGSRYFICSFSDHCSQGMKLEVSVSSSPSTPPSSGPSPPSSPPPPPSGGSSAPPPPANGPSSQSPPPPPPPNGAINMSPYKMSTLFFGVLVLCVGLIA